MTCLSHTVLDCVCHFLVLYHVLTQPNSSQHNCLPYFRHTTGKITCIPLQWRIGWSSSSKDILQCWAFWHPIHRKWERIAMTFVPYPKTVMVWDQVAYLTCEICRPRDCWSTVLTMIDELFSALLPHKLMMNMIWTMNNKLVALTKCHSGIA